jgi:hypothetical protein
MMSTISFEAKEEREREGSSAILDSLDEAYSKWVVRPSDGAICNLLIVFSI